jgi:hypothetical protein
MAEGVIHLFKSIQVQQQQCERLRIQAGQRLLEAGHQGGAVR